MILHIIIKRKYSHPQDGDAIINIMKCTFTYRHACE
jgi:hypothetical protein